MTTSADAVNGRGDVVVVVVGEDVVDDTS